MSNRGEEQYLALLKHVMENGNDKTDRTGVGTRSIFGAQLRFDLQDGFPLLTTKKIYHKAIFVELAWLMRGYTNVNWLQERGCNIWNEWADEYGNLGPVYGEQWRSWLSPEKTTGMGISIDQLQNAVDTIKNNPDSRRIIVNSWNVADLGDMALPPCHMFYQFEVHDGKLSCSMYMRSADMFLGVPFNIASYAALTHYIAKMCDLDVGDLVISFGDCHIYNNHFEQVKEQLSRTPYDFPDLIIGNVLDLNAVDWDSFGIMGYMYHPAIDAPVAV